jgi:hypothetical protein
MNTALGIASKHEATSVSTTRPQAKLSLWEVEVRQVNRAVLGGLSGGFRPGVGWPVRYDQ